MESLFAAVAVVVLVILVCLLILKPGVLDCWVRSPDSDHEGSTSNDADSASTPKSRNAFWADPRPGEDRQVHWRGTFDRDLDGATDGMHGRPGPRESWDPYDPRGEHRKRVRDARRRYRQRMGSADGDYYTLLGVAIDATDKEIEQAYRTRAAEVHPDRFFNDPARRAEAELRLKQLNAAVQVLRDPVRRAQYDKSL